MKLGKISWRLKAGLAAVLVVCVVRFGLVPLFQWRDAAMDRIKVLQGAVGRKKALIANEGRLKELLQQAESSFNEAAQWLHVDFPDPQSLQLRLQQEIETLASTIGINIATTTWLHPSAGDIVQAPVKVRCEGTPEQLMQFIQGIETGERFLTIDRLVLSAPGRTATVTAELDVSAYGTTQGQKGGRPTAPAQASPRPVTPRQVPPGPVTPGPVGPRQVPPGKVAPGPVPRQAPPGQVSPGQVRPGQISPGPIVPGRVPPGQVAPGSAPRQVPPGQALPGSNP